MKCILCGKDYIFMCPHGFCPDCLIWKTHRGCIEEMEKKLEAEKLENKKKRYYNSHFSKEVRKAKKQEEKIKRKQEEKIK